MDDLGWRAACILFNTYNAMSWRSPVKNLWSHGADGSLGRLVHG